MGNICRLIYRPDPEKRDEYYSILLKEKEVKANVLCGPFNETHSRLDSMEGGKQEVTLTFSFF